MEGWISGWGEVESTFMVLIKEWEESRSSKQGGSSLCSLPLFSLFPPIANNCILAWEGCSKIHLQSSNDFCAPQWKPKEATNHKCFLIKYWWITFFSIPSDYPQLVGAIAAEMHPLAIIHFCKRHIMCRIWAKANPSPIRDDIRILNGQQWKSLLVDIYGLFKMCGLYVEVIEDSIDARGEFFQRSSYYQHSPSSCASYRFLRLRLGGGLDRGGGGRLFWHNNISN